MQAFMQLIGRFSMIFFLGMLMSTYISSCRRQNEDESAKHISDDLVDFIVRTRDSTLVEFPSLYNSLAQIATDSLESIYLVDALKRRGFSVIIYERGNLPPRAARFILVRMQNDRCQCDVNKIYYMTSEDGLFELAERIRCSERL